MLELSSSGSVRGVPSNGHPYRDPGPVAAVLQAVLKLLQISLRLSREPFDALAIHPGRPVVARDFPQRRIEGCWADDLIHQTVPLASFDAVAQRPTPCARSRPMLRSTTTGRGGGLLPLA